MIQASENPTKHSSVSTYQTHYRQNSKPQHQNPLNRLIKRNKIHDNENPKIKDNETGKGWA